MGLLLCDEGNGSESKNEREKVKCIKKDYESLQQQFARAKWEKKRNNVRERMNE